MAENDSVDELRDALQGVRHSSSRLLGTCSHALTLSNSKIRPEPTADDFKLALSDLESGDSIKGIEDGPMKRSQIWSEVLRVLHDDLRLWWTDWNEAKQALEKLPKKLVDDSSVPLLDRWSTQLKRALDKVSESIYWTRDTRAGCCSEGVDVATLLSTLQQGGLPSSLQEIDFSIFERDLFAIRDSGASPDGRPPVPLSVLGRNDGEITWSSKTYAKVDIDACELLQELCESYPVPKGLTTELRQQPARVIKKLPEDIQRLVVTTRKGSVLKL